MNRTTPRLALTVLAVVFAGACSTSGAAAPTTTAGPSTTDAPAGDGINAPLSVEAKLDALVIDDTFADGYDRDLFPHWDDEDGDGCDTRCEILARDRQSDGTWLSAWDNQTLTDEADIEIDHVVALADAWRAGAAAWDDHTRDVFADYEPNLLAVSSASNQRKSGSRADEWFPSNPAVNCQYATTVITIKSDWNLTVTSTEKKALTNLYASCATMPAPTTTAAPMVTIPAENPAGTTAGDPTGSGCSTLGYVTADGSCLADLLADPFADLDCADIPGTAKPVTVTGGDQYRLDSDGDGQGC